MKGSKEGDEVNTKYNMLYNNLVTVLRGLVDQVEFTGAQIFMGPWDSFSSLIAPETKELFANMEMDFEAIESITVDSYSVSLYSEEEPPIWLRKKILPNCGQFMKLRKKLKLLIPM